MDIVDSHSWLTTSIRKTKRINFTRISKNNDDMNNTHTKIFTIKLSEEQLAALSRSSVHINKMDCLMSLISRAATEPRKCSKRHFTIALQIGQVALSEVELSALWYCNRKTASKVIDFLNDIGVISSVQGNRTSIHTIRCVEHFTMGEEIILNPFSKGP